MDEKKVRKNKFDAILNVFAWLSFFIAVILSVAVVFSTFSSTENGKAVFGYKMLIVESDSMTKPQDGSEQSISFKYGDLIIIQETTDMSTIAVGDVITFVSHNPDSKGKTISHKVRSIITSGDGELIGFETYGIYTGESDEAIVEPPTIIGEYVGKVPYFGYLFKFFKTPAGFFTSILVPCVLLIIFFSIKVGNYMAKREMAESYDNQLELLKGRLSELELNKGGMVMQSTLQEMALTAETENQQNQQCQQNQQECVAPSQGDSVQGSVQGGVYAGCVSQFNQPTMQAPAYDNRQLEITTKALTDTIDSLTRTIESLVVAVGKPVETLARTVETLASANNKATVVEKTVQIVPPVESVKVQQQEQVLDIASPVVIETPVSPTIVNQVENQTEPTEQVEVSDINEQAEETDNAQDGSIFSAFNQVREKIPFNKKLLSLSKEIKDYFNEIHNELISYKKVNYRISNKGVAYRVGRNTLAKVSVRGKTLKLHLALGVNDYSKTVFFQEDLSSVKAYQEVPFAVKIKSNRAKNNAVKLVNYLAENNALVKDQNFKAENVLKILKAFN